MAPETSRDNEPRSESRMRLGKDKKGRERIQRNTTVAVIAALILTIAAPALYILFA